MVTRGVDLYLVGVSALFLSFLGFWDGRYIPAIVLLVVAILFLLLPSLLRTRQRRAERSGSKLGDSNAEDKPLDIYWVMRIVGGMLILAPGSYALQHGEHALAILLFVVGAGTTYLGWHLHKRRG